MVLLTLLTARSALTLNTILPLQPSMAPDLGARESVTALAVSGYMLASALFQLGLGPLSDRFGRRLVAGVGAWLSTLTAVVAERHTMPNTLLALIMSRVLLSPAAALVAIRLERGARAGSAQTGGDGFELMRRARFKCGPPKAGR